MTSVTEELKFLLLFLYNLNVNKHIKLLTMVLDCTVIDHNGGLCKSIDLSAHPYLYIHNILLTKIKTLCEE